MTYQQWLAYASQFLSQQLAADPYLNAKLDASLLLQFVSKKSKTQIMAFADTRLDEKTLQNLTALLQRRAQGEPMAYILGETEFWTLNLAVSPATLIPRPDTEILVEQALQCIKLRQKSPQFGGVIRILDLGTGTGAIALALAAELKNCGVKFECFGVDLLPQAVQLAQQNALRNDLPEVQFQQSCWFENVRGRFDLIVSNPPYIDKQDAHLSQGDVRFEPLSALVAEQQGYADLQHIIQHAPDYLQPEGWLLLEHGWQQGEKVRCFFSTDLWQNIATARDYGQNERVTLAKLK